MILKFIYIMKEELIEGISLVQMSMHRKKVLFDLKDKIKTPSNIAKSIGLSTSHVSRGLSDLQKVELVILLNPKKKQGRIYQITDLGKEVLKYV